MWRSVNQKIDRLGDYVNRINGIDLVAFMTAFMLIMISHSLAYQILSLVVFALILSPRIRRSPLLWFGIVIAWIPNLMLNWFYHEDHIFFGIYWCAAFGLALWGSQKKKAVRISARWLIGLSMAFAFVWKCISPQFFDGSTIQFKMLFDYRFSEIVTEPVGGISDIQVELNQDAYRDLRNGNEQPAIQQLAVPRNVRLVANGMTWWTIFIEGLLAVGFLLPSRMAGRWRDPALLLFMVSTYIVVPVMGFAAIFCAMGVAQLPADRKRTRLAYLATLALLYLWYSTRWSVLGFAGA